MDDTPVVGQIAESAIRELTECPDFSGAAREQIEPVIISTIRFLARCQDMQAGGAGSRTAYLFKADAKEDDLKSDLIDWYKGNQTFGGAIIVEPQNIGGGRADIVLACNSFRFVIELKRELSDATKESIKKYLPQPAVYQATDIAVGMLVVLDLASAEPPAHLRDNVWVECIPSAESDGTERFVLVVRIPGNRKPPSRLAGQTATRR